MKAARNLLILLCATALGPALADHKQTQSDKSKPKLELGLGLLGLHQPHYPGANQTKRYGIPFPYIVYRGKFLTADRSGLRSILFNSERWVLDLSLRGSLPVNSEDSNARQGMPDLDPSVEFGPELEWRFWNTGPKRMKLQLPVRALIASDFSDVTYEGWTAAPNLRYDHRVSDRRRFSLTATVHYGDANYHDYFFGVDPAFATAQRPVYEGKSGYGGNSLSLSFEQRLGKSFRLIGFTSFRQLSGAAFTDGPLHRQNDALYAGLVLTWTFYRSKAPAFVHEHVGDTAEE